MGDKDGEHWFEQDHHEDGEHWGQGKYGEYWGEEDHGHDNREHEQWDEKERCMCGSVAGHWKFISRHGEEDSERLSYYEEDEHGDSHGEDDGIIMLAGLFAVGSLAGGVMVAVVCFVYQRKRVGAGTSQVVGNCVFGRPATDGVEQTNVVVGAIVEKGPVPTAQETSDAKANVTTDLERGAARPSVAA